MNDWTKPEGRKAIVLAVFTHLRNNPGDIPRILDYGSARELVAKVGDTVIPPDVHVYCLPKGNRVMGGTTDQEKGVAGSLILEIPPDDVPLDKPEIFTYSCTYSVW